jgi:hypothetical protein
LWLPTNDDTKTILYDTKFLKSSPGRYPPLKWTITKIEDTATEGISKFTLAQDQFDSAKDNADLMIADYYSSYVEPEIPELEETPTVSDLEIVYSGKPAVRAGGGYKKFRLKTRVNGELVDTSEDVEWSIDFGGKEDKLECSVVDNVFRVKCLNDYLLIGQTFTITAESAHSSKSIIVEVTSL